MGFSKKKLLQFSSSCMGFSQKKEKTKLFFQNVLFQDKLEINEQKIRFFSKKKLSVFSRNCVGFKKKNF